MFQKITKTEALKNYCALARDATPSNRPRGYDPLENPWATIPRSTLYTKRPKTGEKRELDQS